VSLIAIEFRPTPTSSSEARQGGVRQAEASQGGVRQAAVKNLGSSSFRLAGWPFSTRVPSARNWELKIWNFPVIAQKGMAFFLREPQIGIEKFLPGSDQHPLVLGTVLPAGTNNRLQRFEHTSRYSSEATAIGIRVRYD
jgi:hypothetical protein